MLPWAGPWQPGGGELGGVWLSLQWAEALGVFQQAADWIGLESRKSLWGQFWSAHQRFFKYLCIAAKVRRLVELAQEELARDKVGGAGSTRGPCRSLPEGPGGSPGTNVHLALTPEAEHGWAEPQG